MKQCIVNGLVDGKAMAADGSYIPANVSRESWVDVEIEVEQSINSYLDSLDEELPYNPALRSHQQGLSRNIVLLVEQIRIVDISITETNVALVILWKQRWTASMGL